VAPVGILRIATRHHELGFGQARLQRDEQIDQATGSARHGRRTEKQYARSAARLEQLRNVRGLRRRRIFGTKARHVDAVAEQLDRPVEPCTHPYAIQRRVHEDRSRGRGQLTTLVHRTQPAEPRTLAAAGKREVLAARLETRPPEQIVVRTDRPEVVHVEQHRQLAQSFEHARAVGPLAHHVDHVDRLGQRLPECFLEAIRPRVPNLDPATKRDLRRIAVRVRPAANDQHLMPACFPAARQLVEPKPGGRETLATELFGQHDDIHAARSPSAASSRVSSSSMNSNDNGVSSGAPFFVARLRD
jgi:hypothetical protein